MLQKLKTRVSGKLTYALLLCAVTASNTYSQAEQKQINQSKHSTNDTISISLDVISKYVENNPNATSSGLYIYEVENKNISVYANPKKVEELDKLNNDYEKVKTGKVYGKDPVAEYNKNAEKSNKLRAAIDSIVQNIDTYLSSKEKYDNKKHLLEASQILADNIKIVVNEFKGVSASHILVKQPLRLYSENTKINDKDVLFYKSEILNIRIPQYDKPREMSLKDELEKAKNDTIERSALIVKANKVDPQLLVGPFQVIGIKYRLKDYTYECPKDELIDTNFNVRKYPLIINSNTKAMYFIEEENFINKIKEIEEFERLKNEISKYGYTSDSKGKIKSKMSSFHLTSTLINELNKNPNYIRDIDNKYSQLITLVKQLTIHTNKLDGFVRLYNMQRSKMSASNINSWVSATKSADKIFRQIYELQEKLDVRVSGIESKEIQKIYDTFMDNLTVSSNVLGV